MDCGAHGFFTKNASPELLETAIHRLYHEGFFFDSGLSATIRDAIIWDRRKQYSSSFNLQVKLTEREIEVIKMVCKGSTTTEIAALYKISPRTVETHKTRLMKKLKVKNFIAVILFALKCDAVLIDEL
jgi:DNA-binding NarL/FixJ family response regulator